MLTADRCPQEASGGCGPAAPGRGCRGTAARGVRGKVAGVDRDLLAHVRVLLAQRRRERVEAGGDPPAFLAELRGEAVAGPMRGGAAERLREAGVLRDQVSDPGST